jgi:hypothetical protein
VADLHVLVMAKEPVAGQVKTRLCPPCTYEQAAEIAAAALADTLDAVAACSATRRILALEGRPGPWLPPGFEVVAQEGRAFGERLAHAWSVVGGPGLQIGMDTPQVTGAELDDALGALLAPATDAVLGHALDGGWWAIGLRRADARVFDGVPMSTAITGEAQLARLQALGLTTALLSPQRDLDTFADGLAIAAQAPHTRTASAVTGSVMGS